MNEQLNRELLKQVREAILEKPTTYNQGSYGSYPEENEPRDVVVIDCGTPGCIAGHALLITRTPVNCDDIVEKAQHELGLTFAQRVALFDTLWPLSWLDPYKAEPLPVDPLDMGPKKKPSANDALVVLARLINHGFKEVQYE